MVVFDIDDTILDATQRYKDARRAGLIDKDGAPKRKGIMETPGKAKKRAQEFLFKPDNLRKDKVIPGALDLANDLAQQGHMIAYVTGRHSNYRDVTRNQLEEKGFPLFRDQSDSELLFMKTKLGGSTSEYKAITYAKLLSSHDIRMVFDDDKDNLQEAASLGITGIYSTIQDYTKYLVKSNPNRRPHVEGGDWDRHVEGTDNVNFASDLLAEEMDRIDAEQNPRAGVKSNPFLATQHDEDTDKTVHTTLWHDFQDSADEAGSYDGQGGTYGKLNDIEFQDGPRNNPSGVLPIMSGEPTTQHKKLGAVFAEVQVGRNIFADVGEGVQDMYRGLVGGRQSMSEKRMRMAITTMEKELSDRAKKLGANAVANLKLDFESPTQGKVINLIATADAIKMRSPPKAVRNNPANPSKVKRGKKLYKHMNGKEPESVDVKTVDMGDVWYQVGEGGCWQIGYMSGKETGKVEQKYTHTFNEETKDGNYPKLYATMPESGKPMLIITGGTWKIRTDDKGVAWIYD